MAPSPPSRPSRAALVAILGGVIVMLVAALAASSSARVCASCHSMRAQARSLDRSPHRGVPCYACHVRDGGWGIVEAKSDEWLRMYPHAVLTGGLRGPAAEVDPGQCLGCHRDVMTRVTDGKRIRIRHATCAPASSGCDVCHTSESHPGAVRWPRSPEMDACVACHRQANASVACDLCHVKGAQGKPASDTSWGVTHGPEWRTTHGMGDLRSCDACHDNGVCVRCHGTALPHPRGFYLQHGAEALETGAKCVSCHGRSFCDSCHGSPMPHPVGFLPAHSKLASGYADPACLNCHHREGCDKCHSAHTHPGRTDGTMRNEALPVVGKGR